MGKYKKRKARNDKKANRKQQQANKTGAGSPTKLLLLLRVFEDLKKCTPH